ncbi:site-2 protease family protein [Methanimicrococcus stummii]|uniref:site-2 protease family protein n=1 Tax=Methanimicrococcus stummii TaxID=3028294 RepID=UPI002930D5FA|nr:site-2 protease family protein [Methanimicrococcus sp. Es2]
MQTTTQLLILAFLVYWVIVYLLKKRGILAKYNISATGPILMIETTKGLHLLDKIALPKRFWRLFANVGIVLMFAGMIFMFGLVVFSDISLLQSMMDRTVIEPNEYTEIQNIFLIPGVNQFIPLVWGFIALIVAVFIHEMMHSVLARVEDVRVHSVGLIVALFPIGGFAKIDDQQLYGEEFELLDEPEADSESDFDDLTATIEEIREHERLEKEQAAYESMPAETQTASVGESADSQTISSQTIGSQTMGNQAVAAQTESADKPKAATKTQRSRILAAGVMSNFVVAFIAAMLFFGPVIGAMAPIGSLQITDSGDFSVSSGLTKEMVLVGINGQNVSDIETVNQALAGVSPGDSVTVQASYDRVIENYTIVTDSTAENVNYAGILISSVTSGSPAENAGLLPNSLIFKIDGDYVSDAEYFSATMSEKNPGDTVVFTITEYDGDGAETGVRDITVTLGETPGNESKAYIGIYYSAGPLYIGLLGISVGEFNAGGYLEFLKTLPTLLYSFDFSAPKESVMMILSAWLFVMMMPFLSILGEGFGGFSGSMMQFFEPVGWAEPLGIGIFWIANLLYWVGWLNFYVGLFNCLPALPLDGGHLFRTYFVKIAEKLKMNPKRAFRLSFVVTTYLSGFIFMSFLLMFIWPYISSFVIGLFS